MSSRANSAVEEHRSEAEFKEAHFVRRSVSALGLTSPTSTRVALLTLPLSRSNSLRGVRNTSLLVKIDSTGQIGAKSSAPPCLSVSTTTSNPLGARPLLTQ